MIAEPWVTDIDVVRHLVVVKDTVYRWQEHKGSTRAQDRETVSAIRDC